MMESRSRLTFPALLLAAVLVACGGSSSHDHGAHDHEGTSDDQLACDGTEREPEHLMAVTDPDDAHGAMIEPGATTWMVHLPEGEISYVGVDIPVEHGDWIVSVDTANVATAIVGPDGDRFSIPGELANPVCGEALPVHAVVHIHLQGHLVIEFQSEGPRMLHLQVRAPGDEGDDEPDMLSQGACTVFAEDEPQHVMASSTPGEAGEGGVLMPGELYHLMAPADGSAWVMAHLPTDHTTWAIQSEAAGQLVSLSNDSFSAAIDPDAPNGACPDTIAVDVRVHVHEGGMYLFEIADGGEREFLVLFASEAEGHDMDHGDDGDMDHGDDGDMDHGDDGDMDHGDDGDMDHGAS